VHFRGQSVSSKIQEMSSEIHVLENTAMSLEIQRCPRKLIQRDVLGNTAMSSEIQRCPRKYRWCPRKYMSSKIQRCPWKYSDVLENTAGCPRISSEIQQTVSEIQAMSSEMFTAGVLVNAEDVLGNAMSSEIQRDVLGNRVESSEIHGLMGCSR